MSSTADKVSSLTGTQTKSGTIYVIGRVDSVRRFDGRTYTRLVMPAPDQYSSPSTIEFESTSRVGEAGDDVKVTLLLSGYRNDYKSLDKETGELRSIRSARITLKLVE